LINIPVERVTVRCRPPGAAIQLADAVRKQDVESVRKLIASDATARQAGNEGLECAVIENAITALFQDRFSSEECKAALLKELTAYRGFNRRHIPDFVFKLPLNDARQAIQYFVDSGTAPRISKGSIMSGASVHVSEFVQQLRNERRQRYAEYRTEKILKHKLNEEGPLVPFFYAKRNAELNLNGRIKGTGKDKQRVHHVCRHIEIAMRGKEQDGPQSHKAFKERLDIFSNEESAAKKLNSIGYKALDKLAKTSGPSVQCSNAEFGKLLYKLSGELNEGSAANYKLRFQSSHTGSHVATLHVHKRNEAGCYGLNFRSSNAGRHTMALHVYKRNGRIGVGLHDPNVTANMKHMEYLMEDKKGIESLTLLDFMTKTYKLPPDVFSVIGVFAPFSRKYAGRLFNQDLHSQVDSIWDALKCGSATHLRAIFEKYKEKDVGDQIAAYLGNEMSKAEGRQKLLTLSRALEHGYAEAVMAFADLLKLIPEDARSSFLPDLLGAKATGRGPGLYLALQNGHAEAVKAFGSLLKLIPEKRRTAILPDLLAAKNERQIPGLLFALQSGYAETVSAFGDLLKLVPEDARPSALPDLLAAKDEDQIPGLFYALQAGRAEAVRAFGSLLKLIPEDLRTAILPDLLSAMSSENDPIPGLGVALYIGKADAVAAFGELLELVPEDARSSVLPGLLAAKFRDQIPGLHHALRNGHAGAVRAFGKMLELIPADTRSSILPDLLEARWPNGVLGLRAALDNRRISAAFAFAEIVEAEAPRLSRDARARLLASIREANAFRGWDTDGIRLNEPYYAELIKEREIHQKFKSMTEALKH